MDLRTLSAAVKRATAVRGTVMLATVGDQRRWCCVSASVDGCLELRVGEPQRGWRRWRASPGERWLGDHEFVHVVDAWAVPMRRGTSALAAAKHLEAALIEGLGASTNALVHVLEHPGVLDASRAPAPSAGHEEHIVHALLSLCELRRGKASFSGGRPESTWAWAFVVDDGLLLSPEPLGDRPDYDATDWTVSMTESEIRAAAGRLTTIIHAELHRDATDPLFISLIDT